MDISLKITAIFSLIFAVLIFFLVLRVVKLRRQLKVGYGDNRQKPLQQAISAHANAVETVPYAILMLLIMELQQANQVFLIVLYCVLLFARLIHAYGLSHSIRVSFGRTYGTILTWVVILMAATANVIYSCR